MSKSVNELDELQQKRFHEVLKTLAVRVRTLRLATGMSGRQFAAVVGIRSATLVAIEAGSMNISLLVVFMIAQKLGVDLVALLDGAMPISPTPTQHMVEKLSKQLGEAVGKITEGRDAALKIKEMFENYDWEASSDEDAVEQQGKVAD